MMFSPACFALFAIVPLVFIFLPTTTANRKSNFRRIVGSWATLNAIAAAVSLISVLRTGAVQIGKDLLPASSPFQLNLLMDSVSTMMLALVASVGWVICRYSVRYLDGDANQGRFFKWTAFTLSAVSLTVLSANLFLTIVAFLLTSIGLHNLLLHNRERQAAQFPARLKFLLSRVGDLLLLAAAIMLYRAFGTANLPSLFEAVSNPGSLNADALTAVSAAAWLIAGTAVLKSAMFPFHTWLPETMEAPTPVSALMHAGIVNAGGYLLIRTAPIVSLSPGALWGIAGLGAFTAFFAAVTMQWQTSVKRSLAWSTIAQMGFMILQCGLGAFSAAMLHIIAHSLYKAHAFLNSGTVLTDKKASSISAGTVTGLRRLAAVPAALIIVAAAASAVCWIFAATPSSKPGGVLLGMILALSLIRWVSAMLGQDRRLVVHSFIFAVGLFAAYAASFGFCDFIVNAGLGEIQPIAIAPGLLMVITLLAAAVFSIESFAQTFVRSRWYQVLYVHGSNGFYVDTFWRQLARTGSR